jgi:hypothetical protein
VQLSAVVVLAACRIALACFVEAFVVKHASTEAIVLETLSKLFIALQSITTLDRALPNESVEQPLSSKWLKQHHIALLDLRFSWLDQLSGTSPSHQATAYQQPQQQQQQLHEQPPHHHHHHHHHHQPQPQQHHHQHQRLYLVKLQGMLCDSRLEAMDIRSILSATEASHTNSHLSIRLLCLTRLGELQQAIQLLVDNHPHLALEFGKSFCHQADQWALLIKQVLSHIEKHSSNDSMASKLQLVRMFEQVVDHLAQTLEPVEFLHIMPDNIGVAFIRSYIEKCIACSSARKLQAKIIEDAKRNITTAQCLGK